jgi:purine-binding chemotaxis protein CheW
MLLHLENLLHLPRDMALPESEEGRVNSAPSAELAFYSEATPQERAILHARTQRLLQPLINRDSSSSIPLAVVGLNGEHFAMDLAIVREFSTLRSVTPVPCCPEHIVGQMNLRGDILTLVDIRGALQMPLASTRSDLNGITGKVVVIKSGALQVGVLVDEVFDVMNLQPTDICAVPAAVQSMSAEFLQGTAPCGMGMLSILNLPKILTEGALIVNDEV